MTIMDSELDNCINESCDRKEMGEGMGYCKACYAQSELSFSKGFAFGIALCFGTYYIVTWMI